MILKRRLKYSAYVLSTTIILGIIIQLLGVLSLSKTVSYENNKLRINPVLVNFSDSLLTISNYFPHLIIGKAIANQSEIIRLSKIADLVSQMIKESNSLYPYLSSSQNFNDILKNRNGIAKIQVTSEKLSPIASNISKLIAGNNGVNSLDTVFGKSTARPMKILSAFLEMGQNSNVLFGCEHESKFLLLITSSAETRTLGGLIGQYAVVRSNCGTFKIDRVGTNTDLNDNRKFIKLFDLYPGLFQSNNPEWNNSNLIPDGLNLSKAWISAFEQQFQENIDGVIVVDTNILSKIAAVNGGLTAADGKKLNSAEEIDAYLRNGIYFQFPENQIKRKKHLLEITEQLANSFQISTLASNKISKAIIDAIGDDRMLIYLKNKNSRSDQLNQLNWSESNNDTVYVGVNNLSGSKFDYYSNYSLSILRCHNNRYLLTFSLSNNAKTDLIYPDYVARRLDNYNSKNIGVLNQFVLTYDRNYAQVIGQKISSFSDVRTIQGESNRNLLSIVEYIEAKEKYKFSILFKSKHYLKFRMWGQHIQLANSKYINCR